MSPEPALPTSADVDAAAARLQGVALRTPLISSPVLDALTGGRIFLKAETLQRTGSFKFRGAYNKLSSIPQAERAGGVVAFSSGNHAQGVAAAAKLLSMPAVIVMPSDAPRPKRERTAQLGAQVVLYDRERDDREAIARHIAQERHAVLVPPYDDALVIAGQGTAGREIVEDLAALGLAPDLVIVNASGGGLAAGIALAVKARLPAAQMFTAEPAGFDDHARSFASGRRERNAAVSGTICDALMAQSPGRITFEINRELVGAGVSASDEEVGRAVAFAFRELKLVVEPGGAVALAQKFPARAIQFVVPLAAGSTTDVAARMIAQRVAQMLDAQIIVENRPGSSTMLGSAMVAKAEPDGHTLLMGASSLAVNQNLFKAVPYDTEKDFTPITLLVTAPMVLVVNPALGVKTLGEFLAKFRSVPNVTFASPGAGTSLHLAAEVFRLKTGMDVRPVVYRGGAPALTDVIAGHVQAMFATPVVKQNIDSGDVRALAVTGTRRLALLPDVPTFAELGQAMPELDTGAWFGLFAPARTPAGVVALLNREFNAALRDAELNAALLNIGLLPRGTTSEEFSAFVRDEITRWPPIFARAGILPQ